MEMNYFIVMRYAQVHLVLSITKMAFPFLARLEVV